jgi:hypothetical protein
MSVGKIRMLDGLVSTHCKSFSVGFRSNDRSAGIQTGDRRPVHFKSGPGASGLIDTVAIEGGQLEQDTYQLQHFAEQVSRSKNI